LAAEEGQADADNLNLQSLSQEDDPELAEEDRSVAVRHTATIKHVSYSSHFVSIRSRFHSSQAYSAHARRASSVQATGIAEHFKISVFHKII